MKTLIAAAGVLALATASANAAEIVTKETQTGTYSAPVAGATPQARENPSPGTTVLEQREKTRVEHVPEETVVVRPSQPSVVEERTETHVREAR